MRIEPDQWSTLSRLLDEALEVPAGGLEQWLASLPEPDFIHRAKLRELLAQRAAAETGDFLVTLPKLGISPPGALAPGTRIGAYIIEEEIGRGGMGAVWRARRSDGAIKRPVALKLPHAGSPGQELVERFARERDILGELSHPNIARLDAAGVTETGQPFLALEYVPGETLVEFCDRRRLDVRARLRLFMQVLQAVQHAHSHLVIHRDLKPSNIIVTPQGQAMLLDFGIAKLIPDDAPDGSGRTRLGGIALTPEYASPEQIAGNPVSTASDIYSLGVLLYELLAGDRPYRLKRNSRAELEEAILEHDPQRPSAAIRSPAQAAARGASVRTLARTLRGDLDTIVLKALKKSPPERYATVDALAGDLEHFLRGEPVSARADGGWYRLAKFFGRHKFPVLAAGAAAAALVATAAVALVEAHIANAERDRAVALAERNQAVTEFVNMLVTEAGGADKPVTVGDMLARSESLIGAEYAQNPDHRAAILGVLGSYYHTIGADERGEPLLRDALGAVRYSADSDLRRELTCLHAMSLAGLGKVREALGQLDAVVADPAIQPREAAMCLEYLAYVNQDAGDGKNALRYAEQALQKLHDVAHPLPSLEGLFLGSVGYGHQLIGENDAAEKYFARSIEQFTRVGRDRSPDAVSVRNNWAIVSLSAGEPRKALAIYDETLAIVAQKDPGSRPPQYLLANRARALEALGRYTEARDAYMSCLTPTAAPGMKDYFCLLGLASIERELGNLQRADDYIARTAAILSPSVPEDYPPRISLEVMRAKVAISRGQFADARARLDSALERTKADSQAITGRMARAELGLLEGRLPDALADVRTSLVLAQRAQGGVPYSSRFGQASLLLARILVRQGETDQARAAARTAVDHLSRTVDHDHPWLRQARELSL